MLGIHFENCNKLLFSVDFEGCQLDLSCFYQLTLKSTNFSNCSIREVDFTETNLSGSTFDNCDLLDTTFENSVLENADFRTASNYRIDPEINQIKHARFSIPGIIGLLGKYDIKIDT
jgi:uncharacterized protein YjbI with pentapeptide repeats